MKCLHFALAAMATLFLAARCLATPVLDPLANVTIPAGKSLTLPITATSPGGQPVTYTITSGTNAIAVVMHTNNPFWQLTVAQAAATNAPGAYKTPYRGGLVAVTNVGTMTFMLFPEYAPHTVNVFQGLTYSGFYNSNTIFHRVIAGFMIQGGDPLTNGTGGLAFQYNDEFHPQAIFSGSGQLALANSGPNTDGSQFFVTIAPFRFGDFKYTIFGQLVRGFAALTNINSTATNSSSRPLADEIIQLAGFVTNTTDTVLTLTATNFPGITSKITVIADDGSGRATNSFTAATAADASGNAQPFFYPNTVTNLVAPVNTVLTNFVNGLDLDGAALSWYQVANTPVAYTLSGYLSNSILRTLTYNVTNINGQLQMFLTPSNNYTGPVSLYLEAYDAAGYDYLPYTFVFGDTPVSGQSNAVTVLAGTTFTNALLATFTNGVPASAATNFAAGINWGDDTLTTATIGTNATGRKTVLGSHKYLWPGNYPVYVAVQSTIGASATLVSSITALSTLPKISPVSLPPGVAVPGFLFSLQLPAAVNGSIQVSTNLINWTTFTNFTGTNAILNFRDPSAASATRRFYRALVP